MASRILYILHCFYNRAGVEEHVRDLRQALASEFEVYLLFPHEGSLHLLGPDNATKLYPADPPVWPQTPAAQQVTNSSVAKVLHDLAPSLIHVQHFHNYPLSVLTQVTACGVPTVISYHDYYAVTPYFTMQGTSDPRQCYSSEYAVTTFRTDIGAYLQKRREYLTTELAKFTAHITPSQFLADLLTTVLPHRYTVIEHGIKPFTPLLKVASKELRFGCIGSLLPQKGWEVVAQAFVGLKLPAEVASLHFYGGVRRTSLPNVHFHGAYEQHELPRICSMIDLAVIGSVFAETFSLVLSEMWMGRVPTVASRIGALASRIKEGENGLLFAPNSVAELQKLLRWCIEHREWTTWQLPTPRTVASMASEYALLYRNLIT